MGYKIKVADVRLTPEELKKTEEHIDFLEKKIAESEGTVENMSERIQTFIKKLSGIVELNPHELELIFHKEDYEVFLERNMTRDIPRLFLRTLKNQ